MILVAVFVFCIYIRIIGGVVWLEEGRGRQHVGFGRWGAGALAARRSVEQEGGGRLLPHQALHQLEQHHQAIQQHQHHQALCQPANTKL